MKALFRKKWFRRLCQTFLVLVSLLVLAYVFIDWRGARMKRNVITEMRAAKTSERQGRLIDSDEEASMEKKKREGYF